MFQLHSLIDHADGKTTESIHAQPLTLDQCDRLERGLIQAFPTALAFTFTLLPIEAEGARH